jgi:predicted small metal-binding protein
LNPYQEGYGMAKVVRCRDVGFDCEGVIRAETEGEALAQATEHAQAVHGLAEINDEVVQAVKAAMRDE